MEGVCDTDDWYDYLKQYWRVGLFDNFQQLFVNSILSFCSDELRRQGNQDAQSNTVSRGKCQH